MIGSVEMACRLCWQCLENRVNDWVGRSLAEVASSVTSVAITLTYGRVAGEADHLNATVLTYSDVQKMIKRLRKSGVGVRYFVVGEYGTLKQRAHWHCILYFDQKIIFDMNKNIHWKFWPHGHVYVDRVTHASLRYILKYITKYVSTDEVVKQYLMMMSKKPPIGALYFENLAVEHYEKGFQPSLYYSFSDVLDKQYIPKKFMMRGATAEIYIAKYLSLIDKRQDIPDFMQVYLDKKALLRFELTSVHSSYLEKPLQIHGDPIATFDGHCWVRPYEKYVNIDGKGYRWQSEYALTTAHAARVSRLHKLKLIDGKS